MDALHNRKYKFHPTAGIQFEHRFIWQNALSIYGNVFLHEVGFCLGVEMFGYGFFFECGLIDSPCRCLRCDQGE